MSQREIDLKMSDLQAAKPVLDVLLNARLPASASFRLALFIEEANRPLKTYAEQRQALAAEHGTLSADEQQYTFEGEGLAKFQEGIATLDAEPVTLKVPTLRASDLGEREILSPVEFYALRWLFKEEEEAKAAAD